MYFYNRTSIIFLQRINFRFANILINFNFFIYKTVTIIKKAIIEVKIGYTRYKISSVYLKYSFLVGLQIEMWNNAWIDRSAYWE